MQRQGDVYQVFKILIFHQCWFDFALWCFDELQIERKLISLQKMEEADLDFSEKRTWFLPKVVFLSICNKKEPHSHHLYEHWTGIALDQEGWSEEGVDSANGRLRSASRLPCNWCFYSMQWIITVTEFIVLFKHYCHHTHFHHQDFFCFPKSCQRLQDQQRLQLWVPSQQLQRQQ